jgi:hypothetical protein
LNSCFQKTPVFPRKLSAPGALFPLPRPAQNTLPASTNFPKNLSSQNRSIREKQFKSLFFRRLSQALSVSFPQTPPAKKFVSSS